MHPSNITIKEYTPKDWGSIKTINRKVGWTSRDNGLVKKRLDRLGQDKTSDRCFCWVAKKDSRCVGYVTSELRKTGPSHITFLAVNPKNQKQGIGTALMEKAVSNLRETSAVMELDCEEKNLAFYKRIAENLQLDLQPETRGKYRSGGDKFRCRFSLFPDDQRNLLGRFHPKSFNKIDIFSTLGP